jgi:large subunit ribosomal protein L2
MLNYFFKFSKKRIRFGKASKGGRNFIGRICVQHKGGGRKKNYIRIDFVRRVNQWGYILNTIYDPNRSAFVSLIVYLNGLSSYIIALNGVANGDIVFSGYTLNLVNKRFANITKGSALALSQFPLFSVISNIENKPFNGSVFVRAAGGSALVVGTKKDYVVLKLNSG